MKITYGFSRRGPDRVAEELVSVLSRNTAFEFKTLFLIVHDNLRARNAAGGGEEMLRLRAYEKLQNLVQAGVVKKTGKEYRGVASALVTFMETAAELNAKFAGTTEAVPVAAEAVAAKSNGAKSIRVASLAEASSAGLPASKGKAALPKSSRRLVKEGRKATAGA